MMADKKMLYLLKEKVIFLTMKVAANLDFTGLVALLDMNRGCSWGSCILHKAGGRYLPPVRKNYSKGTCSMVVISSPSSSFLELACLFLMTYIEYRRCLSCVEVLGA